MIKEDRHRFRAWYLLEKEMFYDAEDCYDYMSPSAIPQTHFGELFENPYEQSWIVMQCTGQKDKSGNLIYEGDVIKIPDDYDEYGINSGEIYEVYFKNGGFRLKPKYRNDVNGFWLEDTDDFEILGNVYENPELIKEK